MLPEKVIEEVLNSGLYFDNDLDIEQKKIILSEKDRNWFKENLDIKNINSSFVDYYSFAIGGCGPNSKADCLFTLDQIIENNKNNFWAEEYPNITDRYLQISSIEGEGSYFYDKETDAVYDVDWSQMDDFMSGKLKPRWKSFYDFLEWYYGEEDE